MNTFVTEEDINTGVKDEFGVTYSADGKRLLKGNKHIGKYIVKDGTEVICDDAFKFADLVCITLPDSLILIGDRVFLDCENLKDINLPGALTSIGKLSFRHCSQLDCIILPASLKTIGGSAFLLSTIKRFDSKSPNFIVEKDFLYNEDKTEVICCCNREVTDIVLTENIVVIGKYAFASCKNLRSIILPESLSIIEDRAFEGCTKLESINLPDSLTSIGRSSFMNCNSMKIISISKVSKEKFSHLLRFSPLAILVDCLQEK